MYSQQEQARREMRAMRKLAQTPVQRPSVWPMVLDAVLLAIVAGAGLYIGYMAF